MNLQRNVLDRVLQSQSMQLLKATVMFAGIGTETQLPLQSIWPDFHDISVIDINLYYQV